MKYKETYLVAQWKTRPLLGVIFLLKPFLSMVPIIQQMTALALRRLANYSDNLVSFHNLFILTEQNLRIVFYKEKNVFVLRAVGKYSIAQAIVDHGPLDALVIFKEAEAWALGCISKHDAELSQAVVDAGAESEIALKRIAAS
uniref:Uncharacterized protein n=1 Tax=Cavia porcellus TaxID=10141 RepID=A0A286Y4H7_CAVPO